MNEREGEMKRKAKEARKAVEEDFGDTLRGRMRLKNGVKGPYHFVDTLHGRMGENLSKIIFED